MVVVSSRKSYLPLGQTGRKTKEVLVKRLIGILFSQKENYSHNSDSVGFSLPNQRFFVKDCIRKVHKELDCACSHHEPIHNLAWGCPRSLVENVQKGTVLSFSRVGHGNSFLCFHD